MTSRVSFYKAMLQDLRHRVWMIALSCLGSFLALPVFYLLIKEDWDHRIARWSTESTWNIDEYKLECIQGFFTNFLPITCGIVLVAGAIIVGMFGFRYVFSKKMVDQYHSIPITRTQWFLVHYLNGFMIWFVPMLIGALTCAVMAGIFLGDFGAWISTLGALAMTVLNLILAFLLIYHLTIVAVMLSGNVLNTLVNGAILGFAVIAIYGMVEIFCGTYFDTYYSLFGDRVLNIIWASPLVSAIYQLYMHAVGNMKLVPCLMNIVMVLVMWAAGYVLYLRRPSELAEQGMKTKSAQVIFKTAATLLAGMCGWIFFHLLTGHLAWMIFGAVLVGVLCYGILDIIFHMDFKAFFAHKLQMIFTVLGVIIIGCVFRFDWIGFDSYVPKMDNIASMGICINGLGINSLDIEDRIDSMEYTDKEVIHAFLNKMASKQSGQYPTEGSSALAYVKVTEESGKTYYRMYRVWEEEEELTVPILMDESYIKANVQVPQWLIDNAQEDTEYGYVELESYNDYREISDYRQLEAFYEAYNADMLANPELFIYQEDEVIGDMYIRNGGEEYYYMRLDIYESMEQTVTLLKELGYDDLFARHSAEYVDSITLYVYYDKYNDKTLEQCFGLEEETAENSSAEKSTINMNPNSAEVIGVVEIPVTETIAQAEYREYFYEAVVDKQEDIEELLEVVSLKTPDFRSLFGAEYCSSVDVSIYWKSGSHDYVSIKSGRLPERFLEYFELRAYE